MTRQDLLEEILRHPPYSTWTKTSNSSRLGLGEWRPPKKDNTSKIKLDALGLFDFSENKAIKSLWEIGVELEIPGAMAVSRKRQERAKAIDSAREKMTAGIVRRMNDKERYRKDFLEVLLPYFEGQRKIPFESKGSAFKFFRDLKVTVQRFKKKESGEVVCEIVIPLLGSGGEVVQICKIAVDESDGCRKLGKKLCGTADRDRACIWGNENANEIILFEGIEDAMSFWFCMGESVAGSNIGFVAGSAGFGHVADLAKEYGSKVVICDNDNDDNGLDDSREPKISAVGIGLRATNVLGDQWLRVLPVAEQGRDCNMALCEGGREGVLHWFESLQRIEWSELEGMLEESDKAEDELAQTATYLYHYGKNPWTDSGTVQAFVAKWGSQVRVTEDGSWWTWNGQVWLRDDTMGEIGRKIAALSPVYERLAKMYLKKHKDKEEKCIPAIQCSDWAEKLAGFYTQRGVVGMLRGAAPLKCKIEDFDARPELLNLQNGILNFKTGKLEPHTPEAMCSRICPVAWNPEARCETWDKYMAEITCGDLELLRYKYRQHGYLVSGYTSEKAFFFHLGPPNSGKSTEADTLQWLMGTYAETVKCDLFLEDRFAGSGASDYELARLPGIRLAVAGETSEKRAWSEATIKRFTGGKDKISARHIRQSPFTFQPRFKAIIHGNNKPKLTVGDQAFMNRIHLVPYNFVIEEMDDQIDEKLQLEGSGILNRIYWGYYDWREKRSLMPPQCMEDAKKEYQAEAFADVEEFITAYCDVGEGLEEQAGKLWRAYEAWCNEKRIKAQCRTQTAFGRELGRLGYEDVRKRVPGDWSKNVHYRTKIKLRLGVEDRSSGSWEGEFD